MAETLSLLSLIAYILAGIFLVLSVVFWIVFRIPGVIGDLSGRTARKSIARMRAGNERPSSKVSQPSKASAKTPPRTPSRPSVREKPAAAPVPRGQSEMVETGLLQNNTADARGEATVALDDPYQTELLDETPLGPVKRVGGVPLTMIENIVLVHTDEVIDA